MECIPCTMALSCSCPEPGGKSFHTSGGKADTAADAHKTLTVEMTQPPLITFCEAGHMFFPTRLDSKMLSRVSPSFDVL